MKKAIIIVFPERCDTVALQSDLQGLHWGFAVVPEGNHIMLRTDRMFAREPAGVFNAVKRVKAWLEGLGYVVEVRARQGVEEDYERMLRELREGVEACQKTAPLSYKDLTYRQTMLLSHEDRRELIAILEQEAVDAHS